MTIAIYDTGHAIADIVAKALYEGLPGSWHIDANSPFPFANTHIGYGILRKTGEVFKNCKEKNYNWIHLDNGYFRPGHFDGYYRFSRNGTQQTFFEGLEPDYDKIDQLNLDIKPWRGFDKSKPVLICPPSKTVGEFFGLKQRKAFFLSTDWEVESISSMINNNQAIHIRHKGDTSTIDFNDYNYVLTFNSSMGWKALQAGIPCVSDSTYSMVGSYYHNILLDDLEEAQYSTREQLFGLMASLQFTLQEIRDGKACKLIIKFTSDMIAEKPLAPMF